MAAPQTKIFVVCGATGKQGGAVLRALKAQGACVRGLCHNTNSEAARALTSASVDLREADYDKPETLRAAFEGAYGAFLVTDFNKACNGDPNKEIAHGRALIDACKAVGVRHVVWSSLEDTRGVSKSKPCFGDMAVPHFDGKADIARYALASGVPCTVMNTSMYFENLCSFLCSPTEGGGLAITCSTGTAKLAWIAVDDIGNCAASILMAGPGKWAGKTVGIVGEVATMTDVASSLSSVLGCPVKVVNVTDSALEKTMSEHGMPPLIACELVNMFAYFRDGNDHYLRMHDLDATRQLCGGKTIDARAWAASHKEELMRSCKA